MKKFGQRLAGFAVLPLISAISPFLVLPILSRKAGVEGWAAIGVGQSMGALASMLIIGGWSLYGPARAAPASTDGRRRLYRESLVGRAFLYACALPVLILVSIIILPGEVAPLGAITAAVFGVSGLSPAWFAIVVGSPRLVAKYEVIPRVAGALVAASLIAVTGAVVIYPVMMLAASIGGLVLLHRQLEFGRIPASEILPAIRNLWRARADVTAVAAAGLYSTVPVALVGASVALDSVARFSSSDRIYRMGLLSIVALSGALQGWVAERPRERRKRMRISLVAHAVLGCTGGGAIAIAGPATTAVLFGAHVGASPAVLAWYGLAFAAVSINTSTGGHILAPGGLSGVVLVSTLAGATTGVGAMLALLPIAGATGAAAGLAIGEVVVCAVQFIGLLRLRAQSRSTLPGTAVRPGTP